jgi:hypothetical protein
MTTPTVSRLHPGFSLPTSATFKITTNIPIKSRPAYQVEDMALIRNASATKLLDGEWVLIVTTSTGTRRIRRPTTPELSSLPLTQLRQVHVFQGVGDMQVNGMVPIVDTNGYEFLSTLVDSGTSDNLVLNGPVRLMLNADGRTVFTPATSGQQYVAILIAGSDPSGWFRFRRESGIAP